MNQSLLAALVLACRGGFAAPRVRRPGYRPRRRSSSATTRRTSTLARARCPRPAEASPSAHRGRATPDLYIDILPGPRRGKPWRPGRAATRSIATALRRPGELRRVVGNASPQAPRLTSCRGSRRAARSEALAGGTAPTAGGDGVGLHRPRRAGQGKLEVWVAVMAIPRPTTAGPRALSILLGVGAGGIGLVAISRRAGAAARKPRRAEKLRSSPQDVVGSCSTHLRELDRPRGRSTRTACDVELREGQRRVSTAPTTPWSGPAGRGTSRRSPVASPTVGVQIECTEAYLPRHKLHPSAAPALLLRSPPRSSAPCRHRSTSDGDQNRPVPA